MGSYQPLRVRVFAMTSFDYTSDDWLHGAHGGCVQMGQLAMRTVAQCASGDFARTTRERRKVACAFG